jgi:uncharacterized protein YndB with AHSA1/START domain
MKKLNFSIHINAPVEKVWHTMLDDATYRQWTQAFSGPGSSGSYYQGSWDKGSEIIFGGPMEDGTFMGLIGRIVENEPYKFISIKYMGMIKGDVRDTESDQVKGWAESYENYIFKEKDGGTLLSVELNLTEDDAKMMEGIWPKALEKLKDISEK